MIIKDHNFHITIIKKIHTLIYNNFLNQVSLQELKISKIDFSLLTFLERLIL